MTGKYLSLHYMKIIAASNVLSALRRMTLNILENSTRCEHVPLMACSYCQVAILYCCPYYPTSPHTKEKEEAPKLDE